MFNRTATATVSVALACALALASGAHAETVDGTVSAVTANGQLQIVLPSSTRVSVGDGVQVLAEIPGLGPVAIDSQWKVTNTEGGTVTAMPEGAPSGTPQVGYIVRIEVQDNAATALDPIPRPVDPMAGQNLTGGHSAPVPPEALNLYLAARELAHSAVPADLASAADLYRRAAEMGHPEAMTELGALLSFGRGVNRDDAAALYWQVLAAEHGNSDALFRVGLIHATGRGVPLDESVGAEWIRKSAEQGNATAMFTLAILHEDGVGVSKSMTEMVRWLEKAAQNDHANALFILGHIYLDGEDGLIPEDNQKAELYWLRAAEAGHGAAMRSLSEFYEGQADETATKWAEVARNTPEPPEFTQDLRCLSHWECYLPQSAAAQPVPVPSGQPTEPTQPEGVQSERTVRVTYVVQDCDRYAASAHDIDRPDPNISIEFGDLDAQRVISECLDDISQWPDTRRFYAQIARGYFKGERYPEAFEAAMTGAELGSGQAMAFVGTMYKLGKPEPQDFEKALQWLEKAGRAGSIAGMHFAAGMHLYAEGVPYNPQAAAGWFQNAANAGSPNANTNLGVLYDSGQGLPYDPKEAAANLMIGLAMGDTQAKEQVLQNANKLTQQTRIEIQRLLHQEGMYRGAYDGVFGPQTLAALRARIMN